MDPISGVMLYQKLLLNITSFFCGFSSDLLIMHRILSVKNEHFSLLEKKRLQPEPFEMFESKESSSSCSSHHSQLHTLFRMNRICGYRFTFFKGITPHQLYVYIKYIV